MRFTLQHSKRRRLVPVLAALVTACTAMGSPPSRDTCEAVRLRLEDVANSLQNQLTSWNAMGTSALVTMFVLAPSAIGSVGPRRREKASPILVGYVLSRTREVHDAAAWIQQVERDIVAFGSELEQIGHEAERLHACRSRRVQTLQAAGPPSGRDRRSRLVDIQQEKAAFHADRKLIKRLRNVSYLHAAIRIVLYRSLLSASSAHRSFDLESFFDEWETWFPPDDPRDGPVAPTPDPGTLSSGRDLARWLARTEKTFAVRTLEHEAVVERRLEALARAEEQPPGARQAPAPPVTDRPGPTDDAFALPGA